MKMTHSSHAPKFLRICFQFKKLARSADVIATIKITIHLFIIIGEYICRMRLLSCGLQRSRTAERCRRSRFSSYVPTQQSKAAFTDSSDRSKLVLSLPSVAYETNAYCMGIESGRDVASVGVNCTPVFKGNWDVAPSKLCHVYLVGASK